MQVNTQNKSECKIYPGEFVPSLDLKLIKHRLHSAKSLKTTKPDANIFDSEDTIIVEIFIPGASREDFHVEINENILSVFVLKNEKKVAGNYRFKLHEFEGKTYERHIHLPKNADPSFISALYNQGVLKLLISKSNIKPIIRCNKIAVY